MSEVILNLDYGSYFLKAATRLYNPARERHAISPYRLSGSLRGKVLQPALSATLEKGESLKESFLQGLISHDELERHSASLITLVTRDIMEPLAWSWGELGKQPPTLLMNIHAPLRLVCGVKIIESGLFEWIEPARRLVAPTYKSLELAESRQDESRREVQWASWLGRCAFKAAQVLSPNEVKMAILPESLVLLDHLKDRIKDGKQWLLLDVGHFSTDYCLVAADTHTGQHRLVIRRASSIFGAGSKFIEENGRDSWMSKLFEELGNQNVAHEERPHGYLDLGVILSGGGLESLWANPFQRMRSELQRWMNESLRRGVHPQAFAKGIKEQKVGLPPRLFRAGLSQEDRAMRETKLSFHLPAVLASAHAEEFIAIKIPEQRTQPVLQAAVHKPEYEH